MGKTLMKVGEDCWRRYNYRTKLLHCIQRVPTPLNTVHTHSFHKERKGGDATYLHALILPWVTLLESTGEWDIQIN